MSDFMNKIQNAIDVAKSVYEGPNYDVLVSFITKELVGKSFAFEGGRDTITKIVCPDYGQVDPHEEFKVIVYSKSGKFNFEEIKILPECDDILAPNPKPNPKKQKEIKKLSKKVVKYHKRLKDTIAKIEIIVLDEVEKYVVLYDNKPYRVTGVNSDKKWLYFTLESLGGSPDTVTVSSNGVTVTHRLVSEYNKPDNK